MKPNFKDRGVKMGYVEKWREQKDLCGVMAVIALAKGNEWAFKFFTDNFRNNFKTYVKKVEIWAPGTGDGYDYMRDMTRFHGMSESEALQQAKDRGLYREELHQVTRVMTNKQEDVLERYRKTWKKEIELLTQKVDFPTYLREIYFSGSYFTVRGSLPQDIVRALSEIGVVRESSGKFVREEDASTYHGGGNSPLEIREKQQRVLGELMDIAEISGNSWLLDFAKSIHRQLYYGRTLTERQLKVVRQNLYRNNLREHADLFRTASTSEHVASSLIKLGTAKPKLRPHIRKILSYLGE